MKRKNFTKEEILEIRRLYFDERLSKEKIGREFGCSKQVIRRLFNQQGWESRRQGESSKLSDEEFRRLDQLGISDEEIMRAQQIVNDNVPVLAMMIMHSTAIRLALGHSTREVVQS